MEPDHHLTSKAVDELVAGLLPEQDAAPHLAGCAVCSQKVAVAQAARREFLARNPPALRAEELVAKARGEFRFNRWLPALGLATAAALGVLLFVRTPPSPDVLTKG